MCDKFARGLQDDRAVGIVSFLINDVLYLIQDTYKGDYESYQIQWQG